MVKNSLANKFLTLELFEMMFLFGLAGTFLLLTFRAERYAGADAVAIGMSA